MNQLKNLIGLIIIIGVGYQYFTSGPGPSVTLGPGQAIHYQGSITEAQASSAGDVLKKEGLLANGQRATIQLVGEDEGIKLRFVIKNEAINDPSAKELFGDLGFAVSRDVFEGKPLQVELCNDKLETQKSFPMKEMLVLQFGKNQLIYTDGVPKAQAEKTLELLKEIDYMGEDSGNAVRLSREGDFLVAQFVLADGYWDKEDLFEAWQEIADFLASKVTDSGKVKLKLSDSDLRDHREFVSPKS